MKDLEKQIKKLRTLSKPHNHFDKIIMLSLHLIP
jgi:hypothetical protein